MLFTQLDVHCSHSRCYGWLRRSPVLPIRKRGGLCRKSKGGQVIVECSLFRILASDDIFAFFIWIKTGAFSKVLSLKFLIQMGRLPKVWHPSAHDRGDVQAHCCASLNRLDLLDWWSAPPWHLEAVEAGQCWGGVKDFTGATSSWCVTIWIMCRWCAKLQGSWRSTFQEWWSYQLLEIMSRSQWTLSLNLLWPGIPVSNDANSLKSSSSKNFQGMSWLYAALVDEWGEWVGEGHDWTIK